jgi:hypothetical protein
LRNLRRPWLRCRFKYSNEQLLDLGRYCTPRKINEQILLYTFFSFFSFSFIHLHRNKFNPQLFARDRRLRALSSGLRRI